MKPFFTIFAPVHDYGMHGQQHQSDKVTKQEILRIFARELQREEQPTGASDPSHWARFKAGVSSLQNRSGLQKRSARNT